MKLLVMKGKHHMFVRALIQYSENMNSEVLLFKVDAIDLETAIDMVAEYLTKMHIPYLVIESASQINVSPGINKIQ